jgi:3-oxoacyl-[acyl-carrier-protein] synthase-1
MRVAVTAYSACNGMGMRTADVLANLRDGQHGLAPCRLDLATPATCGALPDVLPELPPTAGRGSTRQLRIGWLAYQELAAAVTEAVKRYGADRVGAVLGTSTGGIAYTEEAFFRWRESGRLPEEYRLDRHAFHDIVQLLRSQGGWTGPSFVVSTACSSSGKVFASARRLLRSGRCDAVVVGGIDSLAFTTVRGFQCLNAASAAPCRPFCANRDGMNVAEGAALLLLERDRPSAVRLSGIGESGDAFHMSKPHPEGRSAITAMRDALRDAGLAAADIDYVNAHGTGTKSNDTAEALAIAAVLGRDVPVVSTKSYTGHLLGAGGATEAIFAVASIEQQWIPANLRVQPVDPEIELHLPSERLETRVRHVLSNSFAFGGSNVSLTFSGGPS